MYNVYLRNMNNKKTAYGRVDERKEKRKIELAYLVKRRRLSRKCTKVALMVALGDPCSQYFVVSFFFKLSERYLEEK